MVRNAVELEAIWREEKLPGDPPMVDFEVSAVVSLTIPGSCVPELASFSVDGTEVLPVFVPPQCPTRSYRSADAERPTFS